METISQVIAAMHIKLAKIAVLTDFSEAADTALHFAAALAQTYEAEIILAHAYIPPSSAFSAPEATMVYEAIEDFRRGLEGRLREKTHCPDLQGIKCTIVLSDGGSKELVESVKNVDLVVVGTTGETGVGKAVFGSTAETVFRSSTAPVLTVGPRCHISLKTPSSVNTVLYATDFSSGAELALPYALSIARKYKAELVLLHVKDEEDGFFSFDRAMASAEPLEKLQALVLDYPTTCVVNFGKPASVILEEAMKRKANFIVAGARSAGEWATIVSHFGGGTAYEVAVHANCPVLTVRIHRGERISTQH